MKKTLAESIRDSLNVVKEAAGDLDNALHDLHNESGGNPTAELADEIAADYGLTGAKLMAAYPEWARTQANKSSPAVDPKKAAQKADYDARTARTKAQADHEARREELKKQQAEQKAKFDQDHAEERASVESYMQGFKNLDGWDVGDRLDYLGDKTDGFMISNGDIKVGIWAQINDKNAKHYDPTHPFEVHFDISYKSSNGKWYTYTRRGIDVSSMSVGSRYGEHKELLQPEEVIQKIEARVAASLERGKDLVEVPGAGGIRINKSDIQAIANRIKQGGSHTLMPAGMGIGWELTNRKKWRWTREAPAEMKKFFGLDTLFMDQIDAD